MRNFLIKIAFFFIAVAMVDVLFGFACQYMNDHSKGGGVKSRYYVCKESNEDVLVFGSSRAKHHYVPAIIEDSLGMTCYNTGEDGNGIIYCYGVLKMITQRYSPKLIIYDVAGFDIFEDDNMKYLDLMKPYYYEPQIDSIFWSVEPKTRLMMLSNLYRYNTTCLRVLGNYIHPINCYPKGYCALHKIMNYEPAINRFKPRNVDSLKIKYFEKFIQLVQAKDIKLICCVSPSYKAPKENPLYESIICLCSQYDVPFINYESDPEISIDKDCFEDRIHMNDTGARKYTSKLMDYVNIVMNNHTIL